jgi:hypothetical protein
MTTLIFQEFIPAKQSAASGKMMPPKAKTADGTTFALNKSVVDLIENSLGFPLDCDTKTEQNGKYLNHFVLSAKHVSATAPVSAPTATSTPTPREAVGSDRSAASSTTRLRFGADTRSDEINRQSARRDAVSLVVAGIYPPDELWTLIDALANYTYKTDPEKNSAPRSVAQQHLEDIREKSAELPKYADEDAVCPGCGSKEHLIHTDQHGWFCSRKTGGCGHPPRGERLDAPISYGEWRAKTAVTSVPWK